MSWKSSRSDFEVQKKLVGALMRTASDMGFTGPDLGSACVNLLTALAVKDGLSRNHLLEMVRQTFDAQTRLQADLAAGMPAPENSVQEYVLPMAFRSKGSA